MKNSDLPAMPSKVSVGEGGCIPFQFGNRDFVSPGLTKREYFAVMAMQGLMAGKDGDSQLHDSAPEWVADVTEAAVEFADALLEELEKDIDLLKKDC